MGALLLSLVLAPATPYSQSRERSSERSGQREWAWRAGRSCLVWAPFPSLFTLTFLMRDDRGPQGSEVGTARQCGLIFVCSGGRDLGFPHGYWVVQ